MLFRPHKKSLLSFGWQGVIPKNRAKLAQEIGVLVGDKLLRQDDIQSAFFSENMQEKLEKAVETELKNFLEKDFGTLESILEKTGMKAGVVISAILESINSEGMIDNLFKEISTKVTDGIYSMKVGELEEFSEEISSAVKSIMDTGRIQNEAVNSISSSINNFVMSGKSLGDIIPDSITSKTGQLSSFITNKILEAMDNALADPNTRKKISTKLVDIKNNHFSEGAVDQLKLGFLNMFMSEDTIGELVEKYLPKLVSSLKESEEVKEKISNSIRDYMNGIINKPIFQHADALGLEAVFQLRSSIVTAAKGTLDSPDFSKKITGMINDLIKQNSDKTLGELLDGIGMKESIERKISGGMSVSVNDVSAYMLKVSKGMQIKNIYSVIPKKLFYGIKITLLKEINKIVEKNTPKMLEAINFPKITEDRINSLNLYEVENLLFSFMKDSFRWINILGFILGFLFGAVQSLTLYLLN